MLKAQKEAYVNAIALRNEVRYFCFIVVVRVDVLFFVCGV
jgi:hypothetical protein